MLGGCLFSRRPNPSNSCSINFLCPRGFRTSRTMKIRLHVRATAMTCRPRPLPSLAPSMIPGRSSSYGKISVEKVIKDDCTGQKIVCKLDVIIYVITHQSRLFVMIFAHRCKNSNLTLRHDLKLNQKKYVIGAFSLHQTQIIEQTSTIEEKSLLWHQYLDFRPLVLDTTRNSRKGREFIRRNF